MKGTKIMQVQTERGAICVEGRYMSSERARMDGYSFAFTAHNVFLPDIDATVDEVDFYSKSLDDRGLRHTFVIA